MIAKAFKDPSMQRGGADQCRLSNQLSKSSAVIYRQRKREIDIQETAESFYQWLLPLNLVQVTCQL